MKQQFLRKRPFGYHAKFALVAAHQAQRFFKRPGQQAHLRKRVCPVERLDSVGQEITKNGVRRSERNLGRLRTARDGVLELPHLVE